jgi:outer membrane receptor protein involved in Fe transport
VFIRLALALLVSVFDENHQPVAGAHVQLTPGTISGITDARGSTRLPQPPPGAYTILVTAHGYRSLSQTTQITDQKTISVTLSASAGALREIGSVTGHARTPFNATPVSEKVYPREAYRDQGQPDITSVMNQTPGVLAVSTTQTNVATPLAPAFASVRNSLPYETPVMIDGEPILTPSGALDLALIPTYVLQEVEVVRGPGDVSGAGGGAGGAINLRTADPTLATRGTYEIEGDSRGGSFSDLAYDGTAPGGNLAFATMLSVDGSPCCGSDPADYWRKAILLKVRDSISSGFTLTTTWLNVTLDRDLDSVYSHRRSMDEDSPYEHLGFGDIALALDRGSDAYSLRVFTAQTQTGAGSLNRFVAPPDDEAGASIDWTHADGKVAFATSGRALTDGMSGTNANETKLHGSENVTYRPNKRSEFDLSGALHSDRAPLGTVGGGDARFGYSYAMSPSIALRTSVGTSAVDPPLEAVSTNLFSVSLSRPNDLYEERASGADAGIEWRLHGGTTTLSADLYRSSVQHPYYTVGEDDWYNGPSLVESGVEVALQQFERVGFGYIASLQLPRTYVWGSNSFLALPQNIGYNAFYPYRIPYAQGYGEISYKWPRGSRLSLGALYVGSHNAYGAPAFVTLNSNLELSLGSKAKLQFSVQNLTNQLADRIPVFSYAMPQYGLTPLTFRFMFRQSFGGGGIYEH